MLSAHVCWFTFPGRFASGLARHLAIFGLGLIVLTGCSLGDHPPDPAARPATITCNAAYRSSTGVPIESEDSLTFSAADTTTSLPFADLVFHAQYSSGDLDNERALRLWISEPGSSAVLFSQLYQLPMDSGPRDQFIGGHGFTGLNYAYHPTSGAELQYWCTAP